MTTPSFTASRVGVACQVAGKKSCVTRGRRACDAHGVGAAESGSERRHHQGGPALAPGQLWTGIGLICNEKDRVLHCVVKGTERGFFVDTSGFVKAPPHTRR